MIIYAYSPLKLRLAGGTRLVDVGCVSGPTAQNKFLVRLGKVPRIGDRLCDVNGNQVARVRDVIGNVDRPFAVVESESKGATLKESMKLFLWKGKGVR